MHVITPLLIEREFLSVINCACYYMGTRPLNKGKQTFYHAPVKLFIQLMYNKNDHLAKWSIFVRWLMSSFAYTTPFSH